MNTTETTDTPPLNPAVGAPLDRGVRWLTGWYANRLHAVPEDKAQPTKDERRALCGAWVSGVPRTEWAEKRVAAGLKTCGHCKRRLLPPNDKAEPDPKARGST